MNGFITNFLDGAGDCRRRAADLYAGRAQRYYYRLSLALNVLGTLLIMYLWDRAAAYFAGA